jgi:predicted dehydrogenase
MRVGIIGLGKLGSVHLRIYKETSQIQKIFLVDVDANKVAGLPLTSFSDYRTLEGRVDLVSIATPTVTHCEIASFFIKRKIPVLVEKPITQNLKEAEELIKLSEKNKTLLFVGHVERYNNAYLAIKRVVKNPLFIECHRLSPYPYRSLDISVVLDLMIHDLDIILDLVADRIKTIEAKGVKVLSLSEDIANARIVFKNGCVANITASRISEKRERKIRIFIPNYYISLDYAQQTVEIYHKLKNDITKKVLPINKEEPLKKEIVDFVNLARNKKFTMESALRSLEALKLALKIQTLIDTDKDADQH